jgi:hypothetical protein
MRKIRHLVFAIPILIGGALASPAFSLELDASNVASDLARALQQRHLADAQELVSQMASCGVEAVRVDGADYPVTKLGADITKLAKGDPVNTMPRPMSFATFLVDSSERPAVVCELEISEDVASVANSAEPPAAAPPPAEPPQPLDPLIAELCTQLEVACTPGGALPPAVQEQIDELCNSDYPEYCPFSSSPPVAAPDLSDEECEEIREETGGIPEGCPSFLSGALPGNALAQSPPSETPQLLSAPVEVATEVLSGTPDLVQGVVGGLLN